MVIICLKQRGVVKKVDTVVNPEMKSVRGLVRIFEQIIKEGYSIDFEFSNVNPREKEIWNIAKKLAELKSECRILEIRKQELDNRQFFPPWPQIPYFQYNSLAKSFFGAISERKYSINILDDGAMEIFDGESVMTVTVSDKSEKDITKK